MREINVSEIEEAVAALFVDANAVLPPDLEELINKSETIESCSGAKSIFGDMKKNLKAAREHGLPICQDTGMAVLFCEVGQDVHFVGGALGEAIDRGVHKAYLDGLLRCSIVSDPLRRFGTGDNTPALVHYSFTNGEHVTLTAAPKGFGSENMSRLKMFTPSAGKDDILDFITETVRLADANPCPPVVLGVGLGSDFEGVALLAKKALCRPVEKRNADPFYASLENEALERVNRLGIGPQGFGGDITALAVNIETAPTHIAGLPAAVNVGCHVTRHKSITL